MMKSVLAAAAVLMTAAPALAEQPLTLQPLRERLRTIDVEINGVASTFLLDTGGGVTTITPQFAERIGCTPWGRITGYRMFGDRLDMQRCENVRVGSGGVDLGTTTVAVYDPTALLAPGTVVPDGSLAMDVFADKVVTLDVAGNRLIIEDPASLARRIEGATELPVLVTREVPGAEAYVGWDTPQGRLWFVLDSGAGGVLIMARDTAPLLGLDPAAEAPQPLSFELAPGVPVEGPAITPEMILHGNLGMPFMKDYVLTIDFPNQRLWVRRNPSA
jgi:hypothetical protein